jgi:hypothetical protein
MKNAIAYSVLELIIAIKVHSMGKLLALSLNVTDGKKHSSLLSTVRVGSHLALKSKIL